MTRVKPRAVGYTFGAFVGLAHVGWAALVAAGGAQPLIDFIFRLHFIEPPYRIAPFSPGTAVLLVLFVSLSAFVLGYGLGVFWNMAVDRGPSAAAR